MMEELGTSVNVGELLPGYMAQHPRTQSSSDCNMSVIFASGHDV
jgi:hypothetical protein